MSAFPEKESSQVVPLDVIPSFVKCSSHHVVLIGDSRVGKTTFVKLLQSPVIDTHQNIYRGTSLPKVQTLFLSLGTKEPRNIVVNILDTPGLNEKPEKGATRHNDELKDLISDHIKSHFAEVDLILLTLKCSGITQGVVDTIFQVKDYFGNKYLKNICLLFTHCDLMSHEEETAFVSKLEENAVMKRFLESINRRIIFTGRNSDKPGLTSDIDFVQEQQRRKKTFLTYLLQAPKLNLKETADLNDLRPIDVLESASSTNEQILKQGSKNKDTLNSLIFMLDQMKALNLIGADSERRDNIIEIFTKFLTNFKLEDATDDEKHQAQNYTTAELPLKRKAKIMREQHHALQRELNTLSGALETLKLKVVVVESPQDSILISSSGVENMI